MSSTHLAVYGLVSGIHYTTPTTVENFSASDKAQCRWAVLLDMATGQVVDAFGTASTAPSAVPASPTLHDSIANASQVVAEPIQVNWDFLVGIEAVAMDSNGKIRGYVEVPDNCDEHTGMLYITSRRAVGDYVTCFGMELDHETMNILRPGLNLIPGNIRGNASVVTRAQFLADVAANAPTTLEESVSDEWLMARRAPAHPAPVLSDSDLVDHGF